MDDIVGQSGHQPIDIIAVDRCNISAMRFPFDRGLVLSKCGQSEDGRHGAKERRNL
jgi:hypothetical protein